MGSTMFIGNVCSFIGACFTFASAWSTDRKRIYLFQAIQCLILAVANVFFASVSGTVTYIFCALRNLLIACERFTPRRCIFFVSAVAILGLTANNRGFVGLIPVVTTALYTVACLYVKRPRAIKLNLTVNLILWAVYDIFILDLVSFTVDTLSAAAALLSVFGRKNEKSDGGEA